MYTGPCNLRPFVQAAKYGLKLIVVLKWSDIYIKNIFMLEIYGVTASLKMEEILKWKGLKS